MATPRRVLKSGLRGTVSALPKPDCESERGLASRAGLEIAVQIAQSSPNPDFTSQF